MFVNQHHLRYLLRPEHYFSDEHFRLEVDRLFLPAWHLVGTKSELARDGDFLTLDLFGQPVLIRNFGGEHFAFRNVCAHRHCQLTHEPKGRSERLKCQYHGWEYDRTGRTAHIPDARCFRPWDRENSQLATYRLEACGDLLFVNLSETGPSLREWLDPHFEETATNFSPPQWKMRWIWEYDNQCNWKVPAENTLESYHVAMLHQEFYGDFYPSEQSSLHTLTPRYTQLEYLSETKLERAQHLACQWLGGVPTDRYIHRHVHPNLILVTTDTLNYALMYLPTSPTTVRVRMRTYSFQGTRRDPFSALLAWTAWTIGRRNTVSVHNEDIAIYPAQQRGLEASSHRGVIGTREERIHTFQKYVLESLGLPVPGEDVANGEEGKPK